MKLELQGVIELPKPLLVAPDALGQTIHGTTELDEFDLVFPALPEPVPEDWHWLTTPRPDLVDVSALVKEQGWGPAGFGLGVDGPRPLASWVHSALVLAQVDGLAQDRGPTSSCGHPADVAHTFGRRLTKWFDRFASWIELWTPLLVRRPLRDNALIRGQVYCTIGDLRQLTGWGVTLGSVEVHASADAATYNVISSAASRASKNLVPPLEWQLLRRRDRDGRQVLIDVATAAEVAMAQAVRMRLGSIPVAAQELIIVNANGAAGLIRLLEQLDSQTDNTWRNRVMSRLAEPRNAAAHGGVRPTQEQLTNAINQAYEVVEKYSPQPRPESVQVEEQPDAEQRGLSDGA